MSMLPTEKLILISGMTCAKIDDLLNELDVNLNKNSHRYFGACPIHGGDNKGAFSLYPTGYSMPGFWKCRSHNCQDTFRPTILGFTRGVISRNKYNWSTSGDKTVPFMDAVNFICNKVIKQNVNDLKVDPGFLSKHNFIAESALLNKYKTNQFKTTREKALTSLQIPAPYYISRGYSHDILKRYDVGLCTNINREMFSRIVFPIYDDNYEYIIGCTGRSTHPLCSNCNLYHMPNSKCPESSIEQIKACKWYNNKGFNSRSVLYNYWFAKKHIESTQTVILVEGPGDVLRLEEAGIHNVVALFGVELSDEQQIILESSGAMNMILLLDNDLAGIKAKNEIKKKCTRSYRIYDISLDKKDVGEMTIDEVKNQLIPQIQNIINLNNVL